ncbi:hypothetical protein [Salmonella enterica]|uniref:hypothetical protein n=1 Tax=Salmonella enterica TaxID=28901 RepID=UPI001F1CB739|nr:hypothetical protein [Salmonella enterica]
MTDLREYGKQIRQFLKLARELQALNIVEDFENKTLTEIREVLTRRSSPGTGYKDAYPRHGARWEEEEKQHSSRWQRLACSTWISLLRITSAGLRQYLST